VRRLLAGLDERVAAAVLAAADRAGMAVEVVSRPYDPESDGELVIYTGWRYVDDATEVEL
jgi:hypothetical protein